MIDLIFIFVYNEPCTANEFVLFAEINYSKATYDALRIKGRLIVKDMHAMECPEMTRGGNRVD